jgi:hypothetical protein
LLSENKPCLLVLNAFAAHKKKTDKEKKDKDDFVTKLKKLNCTISIVLADRTEYVQVLDSFCNKKIKKLISELEKIYYN